MSKNKLHAERSKAPVICVCVILFLIIFGFMMYVTYLGLDYMNYNHKTSLEISDITNVANCISAPIGSLKLSGSVIFTILKLQITKLWWIYLIVLLFFLIGMTSKNKDDFHGVEQGSARWAEKYEVKMFQDNTGVPMAYNFYATINNPKGKSYSTHNLNEAVIGGSGAGKSFRKIKPDIQQMFGSYVVTDPKGELYRDCAKFLMENGYKIRVLNLQDINLSNAYNPFAYMVDEQDCISVANLFMANSAGDGEKPDFWSSAAEDLLVAIMVYLFKTEAETKSFGRVIRLTNSIRYKDGKIDPTCELARCFNRHGITYPDDVVTVNWNSIQGTPEETLGSIAKTLSTRLRLWATSDVDEVTDEDEMDFDHIGVEKTALFLIIPAARQTYRTVANIFYSQLFERLMYIANRDHAGRLPLLVSCELDEFANIGKIPDFDKTLSVVRSYNIRICIVLQGISQLKATYEKTWEAIFGQCSLFTFLGTNDTDSNEYVAKRLGKTTVRVDSRSYNRGNQGGGNDSESYIARDLLAPDEIPKAIKAKGKSKRFGGSCILFVDEQYPFFLPKFDSIHHPMHSKTGSSFKDGAENRTDIREYYGKIREERQLAFLKKREEARKMEEMWMKQDDTKAAKDDAAEQAELAELFDASEPMPNVPTPPKQDEAAAQAIMETMFEESSEEDFEESISDTSDDVVEDF